MLTMSDWKIGAKKYDKYVTDEQLVEEYNALIDGDLDPRYMPTLFFEDFKKLWANALKRQKLNLKFHTTPGFKEFYLADKEPKDELLDLRDFMKIAKDHYPEATPDAIHSFFKKAQTRI